MDLLQTGKFGVLANQQLLGTTSNNITNVNTEGYVRQQTSIYTNAVDWGIGSVVTRRLYDKYAQREMFRDQGNVGFYDAYASGLNTVDKLLSSDDTSIASSLNSFFSSMQSAVQNTTSIANRRELLTQLESMVDRFNTLNYNINNELTDINNRVNDSASTINDLVESIYNINRQIRGLVGDGGNLQNDTALQMMDERDRLVNQLSEYVDVSVTNESDGSYSLYLGNGQLLVNAETYAQLSVQKDEFDSTRRQITMTFQDANKTTLVMSNDSWGGRLGGYLNAADEIRQSKRDLGQLALAIADALNEQNKGGITLENKAGGDLITIPDVKGKSNNPNYSMTVSFNEGEGSDLTSYDYQVRFNADGDPEVYYTTGDGKYTKVEPINPQTDADGNLVIALSGDENTLGHGITLTIEPAPTVADSKNLEFYAQPTLDAAYNIKCNITKPEEFAFASAIRVNTDKHAGNAVASLVGVTQTGDDMGIEFDSTTNLPKFADGAPNYVKYIEDPDDASKSGYYVFSIDDSTPVDEDGNPVVDADEAIGFAPADCNGQNIFASITENNGWTSSVPEGYPGYEVSFTGTVVNGSSFQIEINENGSNDNSNGNLLAQLQQEDLVRSRTGADNHVGFSESYADLTSSIGSAVMSATTDLAAAQAKCTQSQNLFSSVAGVNLDEEAANLVRYQQSYAACSKIINASQTVFDALLGVI